MSSQIQQMGSSDEIVTRKEVARRLGVSTATVKRADDNGLIVGFRVNGPRSTVRYCWREVYEALRGRSGGNYVAQ